MIPKSVSITIQFSFLIIKRIRVDKQTEKMMIKLTIEYDKNVVLF